MNKREEQQLRRKLAKIKREEIKHLQGKCIHGLEYCAICKYGDGKKIKLQDNP